MNKMNLIYVLIVFYVSASNLAGQTSFLGNNQGAPGYLGWNASVNFPLTVEHQGTGSMRFITNSVERMSLHNGWGVSVPIYNSSNAQLGIGQYTGLRNMTIFTSNTTQLPVKIAAQFKGGDAYYGCGLNAESFFDIENGQANLGVGISASGGNINYGLFAEACAFGANSAAFFSGDVVVTGAALGPSDENLKTNIEYLEGENNSSLLSLPVYTYFYEEEETTGLDLSSTRQYGFIAQEVEAFFPSLVKVVDTPVKYNEEGEIEREAVSYMVLDYQAFIPLLVDAFQSQNLEVIENQEKINELEGRLQEVKALLSSKIEMLQPKNGDSEDIVKEIKIYPNPSDSYLILEIELKEDAMVNVTLEGTTKGKVILTDILVSKNVRFTYDFSTHGLSRGTYIVNIVIGTNTYQRKLLIP